MKHRPGREFGFGVLSARHWQGRGEPAVLENAHPSYTLEYCIVPIQLP